MRHVHYWFERQHFTGSGWPLFELNSSSSPDLIHFFLCFKAKYYALLLVSLLVFRKSKTNVLCFLENVVKLFPKLGHCSCKILVLVENLAKNNRANDQPLLQGKKKILRLAKDRYLPFCWNRDQFFQLGLNYFWDESLSFFKCTLIYWLTSLIFEMAP